MQSELTLVLLPGLDGTGKLFRRFVERASSRFRTQVISYAGDREMGYSQLEQEVRPQLPTDRPYLILGESFSGPLAISLAARPDGNLRGLILSASFATPPGLTIGRFLPWHTIFRISAPLIVLRHVLTGTDRSLAHEIRDVVRDVSPHVLAARVRTTLAVDVREKLGSVRCSIFYLQARRDIVVSRRCLREILAVRPDVTVERIDTQHPLLQLEPEAACNALERWVSSGGVRQ